MLKRCPAKRIAGLCPGGQLPLQTLVPPLPQKLAPALHEDYIAISAHTSFHSLGEMTVTHTQKYRIACKGVGIWHPLPSLAKGGKWERPGLQAVSTLMGEFRPRNLWRLSV